VTLLERIGHEALPEIERYLWRHPHENILLLSDLRRAREHPGSGADAPSLVGYRLDGTIVAVLGFYPYGRWLPHFECDLFLAAMIGDALRRRVRWLMGGGA
jgi:hypothetical protein